jgi:hypothetical protein
MLVTENLPFEVETEYYEQLRTPDEQPLAGQHTVH